MPAVSHTVCIELTISTKQTSTLRTNYFNNTNNFNLRRVCTHLSMKRSSSLSPPSSLFSVSITFCASPLRRSTSGGVDPPPAHHNANHSSSFPSPRLDSKALHYASCRRLDTPERCNFQSLEWSSFDCMSLFQRAPLMWSQQLHSHPLACLQQKVSVSLSSSTSSFLE